MLGTGLIKGLKTTLKAFFSKPITILWPYEKVEIPDRGQGLIRLRVTQLDPVVFKCTGCGICAKNCPQHCITVMKKEDEKQPEEYTVNYGLCMFCRICIDTCPFSALEQTQEHEFIGESRADFFRSKEELMMKTVYVEEVGEKEDMEEKVEGQKNSKENSRSSIDASNDGTLGEDGKHGNG